MKIIKYTVEQNGRHIFSGPIRKQAVNGALGYAKKTGRNVVITSFQDDGGGSKVICSPDGTLKKLQGGKRSWNER